MIALSNRISSSIKYFFYLIFFLIFLLELFFQIAFIFNLKTFKKTILFFNPFCDQVYWDLEGNSSFNEDKYLYNSTLTIIKKENFKFFNKEKNNNNISQDNELIFYGSSFLDHEYFISYYKDNLNFAIKSYGFDQIFKSYMMTKNYFPNKNIIIGFLLEDIDRAIFVKRDFPKLKYKRINDKYELTNVPISFESKHNKKIHFYSLKFFRNLIFLLTNDFNYNNHQCKIAEKKLFFEYALNEIIENSKKLNQNIIFLTFNFKNNVNKPNWRYSFINNLFLSKDINYLDSSKIIKKDLLKSDNLELNNYYNQKDFHLSSYGYKIIKEEIDLFIEQYK